MFNRIMEHDGGISYIKLIDDNPTSFEMTLFSYISQLQEADKRACVTIYKYEGDITITAHRATGDYIVLDKSDMSDSFSQYTLVDGDVEKRYDSLFDIDIPCRKTVLLTKHDHELILKVV